jgi:hypothetical protein
MSSAVAPVERWAHARPNASMQGKRKMTGHVPPGPWYDLAWRMLSEPERLRLSHKTRMGRHTPVAPTSPVSALSNPSKMPGASFGMVAGAACPGAVRTPDASGNGAICGSCYADRGGSSYTWPSVKRAYLVRFYWALLSSRSAEGRTAFVAEMASIIARNTPDSDPYFRIHDSGDFFNAAYVDMWAQIIALLPAITFWAPTRSWHLKDGSGAQWTSAFAALNAHKNAVIRPSALHINQDAPQLPGFAAGSGVKRDGWNCPASEQGNACRDCRQCWNPTVEVYYHLH